jgi:hypothetical protein
MARHAYDPREVITGAVTAPLRHVTVAVVLATFVMLLFGSPALLTWAEGLPVGPIGDAALEVALRWHNAMSAVGLDQPYTALRRAFRLMQAARW